MANPWEQFQAEKEIGPWSNYGSPSMLPQAPAGPHTFSGNDVLNKVIDFLRPNLAGAAGIGAGALTAPLAGTGLPLAAETQAYAGTDYLLKKLKTQDAQPASNMESLIDSEKDALINAVGTRIVGGVVRGIKGFNTANIPEIYSFKPTTSQALEAYGYHKLGSIAKFFEDVGATGAKEAALDRSGGAGFTKALKLANTLNGRMDVTNIDPVRLADAVKGELENGLTPGVSTSYVANSMGNKLHVASQEALDILQGGKNPFAPLDAVIQDPDRLSKILAAGQLAGSKMNVRQDLQAYQFMRMVNEGTVKDAASGATRLDAQKIANIWNNPELKTSLDTLYGKKNRGVISDFIRNVATTQDTMQKMPFAKQIRLVGSGFAVAGGLANALITDHIASSTLSAAGGIAGIYIPSAVMGNLLTKESTARILTSIAGGEPLTMSQQMASRLLFNGLQGSSIALMGSDGKQKWLHTEKDQKSGEIKFVENK